MIKDLKKLLAQPGGTFKIIGLAVLALIVLSIVWRIVGSTFQPILKTATLQMGRSSYDEDMMYADDMAEESMGRGVAMNSVGSMPSPEPPREPYVEGEDAEDYEVTQYHGNIRTRFLDDTCMKIEDLKSKTYVIFENANRYERGCHYSFKVENKHKTEILDVIESLDPDNLSENTYTIKRTVDAYTNEIEILEQKLATINATFEDAKTAYDEITEVARSSRDAESLATIIDSKVRLIERLTQERLNITQQLNRMQRNIAEQMDRLDYTQFSISVSEDKYIDKKAIQDSWKAAMKEFVRDFNSLLQDLSIHLITTILMIVQYTLYALIVLFIAKYGWSKAKKIWKK